jgi:hypothetical protein
MDKRIPLRVIVLLVLIAFVATSVQTPAVYAASKYKVAKVTSVKASAGAEKITVKWKKNKKASGYYIYMAKSKTGKFKKVGSVKRNKTVKFTVKNLKAKKRYYFKVKAFKKKNGKIYKSKFSAKVSALTKAKGYNDPKSPNYSHVKKLPPLTVDEYGAYHIDGNASDTKGAYALYSTMSMMIGWKAGGEIPVVHIKAKDSSCKLYYTTDGSTPSPQNGSKVVKSDGEVKVYLDKSRHTIKMKGFVSGKEVFHDYFTEAYLYYYDRLPEEDPGPLVGGLYQDCKWVGLVDGLIWWE